MKRLGKIPRVMVITEIVYKDGRVSSIVEKLYLQGRHSETRKLKNLDQDTRDLKRGTL